MSLFIAPPGLYFIDLPDWISNTRKNWLAEWHKLRISRTYRWNAHDGIKYVNYSEKLNEVFWKFDNPELFNSPEKATLYFKEMCKEVNILIDEIETDADEILAGIDEKVAIQKEEDLKTWKFYISKNNFQIEWVDIFFDKDENDKIDDYPSAFEIYFNSENTKKPKRFIVEIFRFGFDKAFELAIEKICEFREIELTPEIRETFMKAKKWYPTKRYDLIYK